MVNATGGLLCLHFAEIVLGWRTAHESIINDLYIQVNDGDGTP